VDAAVTEVGGEVRQLALGVDALSVPVEHPMDDEGVAEIVDAGAAPSGFMLEAGVMDHPAEQPLRGHVDVAALAMTKERCVASRRQPGPGALVEIALERCQDGRLERQPTGLEELAFADLERALVGPKIAELQPDDLADAEPGAVCQNEHGVHAERS